MDFGKHCWILDSNLVIVKGVQVDLKHWEAWLGIQMLEVVARHLFYAAITFIELTTQFTRILKCYNTLSSYLL